MHQIIYSSAAVAPFTELELTLLLARARSNNTRLGVTGMLLYQDGSFLQVIEGEAPALENLFRTIGRDERHTRVLTLLKRAVDTRHFGEWAMGFVASRQLPKNLPGYSEYLRLRGAPTESANAAARVLAAFREGRFRSLVTG